MPVDQHDISLELKKGSIISTYGKEYHWGKIIHISAVSIIIECVQHKRNENVLFNDITEIYEVIMNPEYYESKRKEWLK